MVAGTNLTYTLTVTNNITPDATSDATGVVVTDTLPPEVIFVSATPGVGQGTASYNNAGVVTWNVGNLPAGSNATLIIVVTVKSSSTQNSVITNTATVQGIESDPVQDHLL